MAVKFIKIPVTGRGNMTLGAENVVLVEQKSTTKVRVSYEGGTQADITHEASASGSEEMRTYIEDLIEQVNQKVWQTTSLLASALPKAVTDISVSLIT